MITFPELAAAVPAWSDGLCASAGILRGSLPLAPQDDGAHSSHFH
jgi:hypothetical protein